MASVLSLIMLLTVFALAASFHLRSSRFSTKSLLATVPLVAGGKRYEAPEGSSLNAACTKLGLKVPYSCKKGECATCTVTIAGTKYRPCVAKVPPVPKLKSLIEKGLQVSVDNK